MNPDFTTGVVMSESNQCPSCGSVLSVDAPAGLCPDCLLTAGLNAENGAASSEVRPSRQPTFVSPPPEALAAHFPQLEILEPLGQGGMGAVYKARQTKLDRMVALKILRPESADDPAFAERFNREARTLARLQHPNIVAIHDFGEVTISSDGTDESGPRRLYYFLMEYVDGANLRQLIQAGNIQQDQALVIVGQICEALQFAHDEHVVHRDVKPENILVDSRGRVKIADFGLAKLAAFSQEAFTLTGTHQVMGTPRYMAPEQMEGSRLVDHRADVYSLGVMFYEMLTGHVPAGHFDPPSTRRGVDPRLDHIVLRALAREPHRRYQSVGEFRDDVAAVAGSSVMNSLEQIAPAVAQAAGTSTTAYLSELEHELMRIDVRGPAGGLILTGFLGAGFWIVMGTFLCFQSHMDEGEMIVTTGGVTAAVLGGAFLVFSGIKLQKFRAYELCLGAAILSIFPWSPAALIGIPIGIWTLRTLRRNEIKRGFAREALRKRGFPVEAVPPPRSPAPVPAAPIRPPHNPPAATAPLPGPSTILDRGVAAIGRWFGGS